MSKIIFLSSLISFIFASFSTQAAQMPRYLGTERKFRSYVYNPNDVYRYVGHYTYQGFIEFEPDETIGTISMGDPTLWLFEHLGNRLFLKPIGEDHSETNMTVITNKKVYHFELMAKEATGITDKDLIFVAKFVYPDEKDKNIVQFPKVPPSDKPDMRDLTQYNFSYEYTGEPAVAPLKVFDNGEFTYFQFSSRNAEIPAIFTVDAAGFESLVNFRAVEDYIIVERVSPQFTLRNGNDIVCVYNTNLYLNGRIKNSTLGVVGGRAPSSANAGFRSPTPPPSFPAATPNPIAPPSSFQGGGFPGGAPSSFPASQPNIAPPSADGGVPAPQGQAGTISIGDYFKARGSSEVFGKDGNTTLPAGLVDPGPNPNATPGASSNFNPNAQSSAPSNIRVPGQPF